MWIECFWIIALDIPVPSGKIVWIYLPKEETTVVPALHKFHAEASKDDVKPFAAGRNQNMLEESRIRSIQHTNREREEPTASIQDWLTAFSLLQSLVL